MRFSRVYQTAPQNVTDQPDFLNAVARIETDESPEDVHAVLQQIEMALGKAPPFRFGPRTIDLDLLLYDERIVESDAVTIPHPRMHERRFVLEPLCEVLTASSLHPVLRKSIGELLAQTNSQHIRTLPFEL